MSEIGENGGLPSDSRLGWQPVETLSHQEQRQRIIDTEFGGDEEKYLQAAHAVYTKAREKLEQSKERTPAFPHDLYKQTFEFRAVEVGLQAEWSQDSDGPIRLIHTSPSRWVIGTLILPTATYETQVRLDEYGGGIDLMEIGTGERDHPAVREISLRLSDPRYQVVLSPERADLHAESLYY